MKNLIDGLIIFCSGGLCVCGVSCLVEKDLVSASCDFIVAVLGIIIVIGFRRFGW